MKNVLYENGIGWLIGGIIAVAAVVIAAYYTYLFVLIFTPLLVPAIFIFFKKVNKLLSGIIGVMLFAYYVFEIKLRWPSSMEYFFNENSILGIENFMYLNILNYIGLALSLFMIYLYVDNKKFR